jgi:trans-2,3-dihydro-3-hydroxyanthranilate isomerase
MEVCVQHWDAFTRQPGKGNPAGIVLAAQGLSDLEMQKIATRIGFNDTAFVLPSQVADVRIRYFSPRREVDLCGHATIAAFTALQRQLPHIPTGGLYTLETRAGILPIGVEVSNDNLPLITMTQGAAQFVAFHGAQDMLARAIGIEVADFHATLPIIYGSTGRWTLVVPVKDLQVMQRMCPFPDQFAAVLTEIPDASIHPFCLETIASHANMHARHFSSPTSGTVEDAVTGTASGVLGAYHRRFIAAPGEPEQSLTKYPLVIEQGYEVGREGIVEVWASKQGDDYAVRIAGSACFVREIDIV